MPQAQPWQHFVLDGQPSCVTEDCAETLFRLEVVHSEYGAPQLRSVGDAYSIQPVLISLSHDGDLAGAVLSGGCLGG